MTMDKVTCKKCGYYFEIENLFGKFCPKCKDFIESEFELPIVKENKIKNEIQKQEVLEKIKKSFRR